MDPDDKENRKNLVERLLILYPEMHPYDVVHDVDRLGDLGYRARRHAEKMCSDSEYYNRLGENGDLNLREEITQKAVKVLKKYNRKGKPRVGVTVGGDPRGYAFNIHIPDLRGNTWGGDESGYGLN